MIKNPLTLPRGAFGIRRLKLKYVGYNYDAIAIKITTKYDKNYNMLRS